jgi:hypothetical protein
MEAELICVVGRINQLSSASTDKVNNLVPVPGLHAGCDPLRPRKDLQVALDGNAVGGQPKVQEQSGNAKPFGHFTRFSIHYNLDSWIHYDTGAGVFSRGFDFSRNRNSP